MTCDDATLRSLKQHPQHQQNIYNICYKNERNQSIYLCNSYANIRSMTNYAVMRWLRWFPSKMEHPQIERY